MLKIIKKIIKSTIFCVPVIVFASSSTLQFDHMNFNKGNFNCKICTESNCFQDLTIAGHCAAWCDVFEYKICWSSALGALANNHTISSKTYGKLSSQTQEKLKALLMLGQKAAQGNKEALNQIEDERSTVDVLLKELQAQHLESRKERVSALAAGLRLPG